MKYYSVIFKGTPNKEYFYKSKLNLPIGAEGKIVADNETTYHNQVTITRELNPQEGHRVLEALGNLRQITSFQVTRGVSRPNDRIKQVYFNKEKKTTVVIWDDGKKTTVKCQPQDEWDEEKALALCYMKRILGNRGSFNETLKKWCNQEELCE